MKRLLTFVSLFVLGGITLGTLATAQDQAAKDCPACVKACADARDKCKLNACRAAGGHSQSQSSGCFNIPPLNLNIWMDGSRRCENAERACNTTCKASGNCK